MSDLPRLLRDRTADLHAGVEDAAGLPGAVRSRADYVALLQRFRDLHVPLERRLDRPAWGPDWARLGLDPADHRRAHLLEDDLRRLGEEVTPRDVAVPPLTTFGEALGCLYVLEGSAIGGRVLAPALRAALGDVPTAFLDGRGREQAGAWQRLRAGLRSADPGLGEDAVRGARAVFAAFGDHLPAHR